MNLVVFIRWALSRSLILEGFTEVSLRSVLAYTDGRKINRPESEVPIRGALMEERLIEDSMLNHTRKALMVKEIRALD